MNESYTPSKKILKKYADVLVNFGLGNGEGIKKGDVVLMTTWECAKPLYAELLKAIWKAGGHAIARYLPCDDDKYNMSKDFYNHADDCQLCFFPQQYLKGIVDVIDHQLLVISETNMQALKGVDPKKIMKVGLSKKPYGDLLHKKEDIGKLTWVIGMYGTPAMAKEAGLSEKEYWEQITKACFLDKKDPIAEWKKVFKQIHDYKKKLSELPIDKLHIKGPDADLWITLGEKRKWLGGSGCNIPSFEIFTSPNWRGTNGWIKLNQPLYRYGNLIEKIELEFKNGKIIKSKAKKNNKVLKEMIATEGANQIGEFALVDKRFSKITKFMADSLYDENVGGPNGSMHIALGSSFHDAYTGDIKKAKKSDWKKMGFNDSSIHADIISTAPRTVTSHLKDGSEKVIYENGVFVL